MTVLTQFVPLDGGLNLVDSVYEIPPGEVIYGYNYEAGVSGGYRRIDGFERYSGEPIPSEGSYWIVYFDAGQNDGSGINKGTTITGNTSGATGKFISQTLISGSFGNNDAVGYYVLTDVSGEFQDNETIKNGATNLSTSVGVSVERGSADQETDRKNLITARNYLRSAVDYLPNSAVPAPNAVTGIHHYNDAVYVFADIDSMVIDSCNAAWDESVDSDFTVSTEAGQAGDCNKFAIAAGAIAGDIVTNDVTSKDISDGVNITAYVKCSVNTNAGDFQLLLDDTASCASPVFTLNIPALTADTWTQVTLSYDGTTSGAAAIISVGIKYAVDIGACDFFIDDIRMGEYGAMFKSSSSGWSEIRTRLNAGGRYECINYNFTGHTGSVTMYGVDGANKLFSYDGTTFTQISTGMTTDTPNHICAHKNYLYLSFPGGSLQNSSLADPTSWSAITGAAEISIGENIVSLKSLPGGVLAVMGRNKVCLLYGSSDSDKVLVTHSKDTGAIEWTVQEFMGGLVYLDDRGITTLSATEKYGNFQLNTISHKIQPLIDKKKTLALSSCIVREKNQYRLFFSDDTAVYITFGVDKVSCMYVIYPFSVSNIVSKEDSSGKEVIYFSGDYTDSPDDSVLQTLYVYQMDKGTSFDGSAFSSLLIPAFNHFGTPQQKKRFREITFDIQSDRNAVIKFQPLLDYDSTNKHRSSWISPSLSGDTGGYWQDINVYGDEQDIRGNVFYFKQPSGTTNHLYDVAYSDGLWCAVGASGKILTSADGETWTARTSGTANHLYGIAHNKDASSPLWVAVGASGTILTSPDGVTWTTRTSGTAQDLTVAHYAGSLWHAAGGAVRKSSDGITWSGTTGISNTVRGIGYNGTTWAAGALNSGTSTYYLYSSTDGNTWTEITSNIYDYTGSLLILDYFTYAGGYWIASLSGGKNAFYISDDLTTWDRLSDYNAGDGIQGNNRVAYINNKYLYVVGSSTTSWKFYISDDLYKYSELDGYTEYTYAHGTVQNPPGIGTRDNGDFVIVGANGTITKGNIPNISPVSVSETSFDGHGQSLSPSVRTVSSTISPYVLNGYRVNYSPRGLK